MTMRLWLTRAYRLADRLLISRLPTGWQRGIVSWVLRLATFVFPAHAWPPSAEQLLVRRLVQRPPKSRRTLPGWALEDMNDLALHVDSSLSPEGFLALRPESYDTPVHWVDAGKAYYRICERVRGRTFDTVMLVPWLARGGADLGALHHARACHEVFRQRILVISTERGDSPWATRLPEGVQFLDISGELATLSRPNNEPEMVLARLLIQLSPTRIHIINSHLAWRTIGRHGLAIRQTSRIYASLYCDERNAQGHRIGLAQDYLSGAALWLDAVITDNSVSPREWGETLGVDPRLFHVVHFPARVPAARMPVSESPGNHLLWASRLARQKRPQLLAALVEETTDFCWDIHGTAAMDEDQHHAIARLSRSGNVTLHGAYEDFMQIVARGNHHAFVYTSAWDGLPNVLLEAASAQLPIVAADVGGARDLIPDSLLLPPESGVQDYARAIRNLADPALRVAHLRAQQERLAKFTWENFVSGLRTIPHYADPS